MISKKYLRKNLLRNDFLHSYFRQVFQELLEQMHSKIVLLYLYNKMPSLPEFCGNTFIRNWLTSFHNFHGCTILVKSVIMVGSCFILAASINVTWAFSFGENRFKLEAKDFIFNILQRNSPNFGVKILA